MAERSKAHAWKACRLQKGLKGSNPFLSAIILKYMKKLKDFPQFTAKAVYPKDKDFIVSGSFDHAPFSMGERYWLIKNEECFIGDVCELDPKNKTGAFNLFYKEEIEKIRLLGTYTCITSRWNWDFMSAILNRETHWERETFQVKDAQVFYLPNAPRGWLKLGGKIPEGAKIGEIIKDGWDHEECGICRRRIGKGGESEFYIHDDYFMLCVNCFNKYALNQDLSFAYDNNLRSAVWPKILRFMEKFWFFRLR